MGFTPDEILIGILGIIGLGLITGTGLAIASRYLKYKENLLLIVGLCWAAMSQSYWPTIVSFIIGLFNDGVGLYATPQIYLLIGTPGTAIPLPFWIWGISGIIIKEKQKILTAIVATISILYLIYFFALIGTPTTALIIGEMLSPMDLRYNGISLIYLLFQAITIFISGISISIHLLKSDIPENRLKGIFLAITFLLLMIGAIIDSIATTMVVSFIARLILIFASVTMYFGWLLPEKVKNIFIK